MPLDRDTAADRDDAEASARVPIVRVRAGRAVAAVDTVAVEAPLEIRIGQVAFATIMRTPGQDRELAAGFLLAERVLRGADDLGAIAHCRDGEATAANVIAVTLLGPSAAAAEAALRQRRAVVASASCGVCGRRTIDDLAADCPVVAAVPDVSPALIASLPSVLRARQTVFTLTGGLHAAGLFTPDGRLAAFAEDVGRHNAVDKVIGRLVLGEQLPAGDTVLFVSGRTSFEIVQKAWVAGIPCVASVSAPTSLAIDIADAAGIRLIGFVRDEGFNVYTRRA